MLNRTYAIFLFIPFIALSLHGQQKAPAPKLATPQRTKPDTPHLAFATEYIRQLSAYEEIRDQDEQENAEAQKSGDVMGTFRSMIHSGTLFQLELRSDIAQLEAMRLSEPFDFVIPTITGVYEEKIRVWQQMVDIGTAFIEGPKPDVDYGKLGAEMPKLRANLDFVDQTLLQISPAVFATLIDVKEDSQGHASHLIITKAERQNLIDKLNTAFGSKLDQKNQNDIVSSASVLRAYLLKDFKSADEPWE